MIRERAAAAGAVETEIIDAREEFARDFLVPALHANALYEGKYPLVSALSRPVIVEHLVASARRHGADAVAHGCTGKGNDQVRFEVSSRVLAPDLDVMAPVRVWGLTRADCIELADKWEIPISASKEKLYSIDENMWGRAIECGVLENPWAAAPEEPFTLTRSTKDAPSRADARSSSRSSRACRSSLDGDGDRPRRADRDDRPVGRRLRLGPHRHGREPPGRHQEPRGLRVPGVARADPGAQGPRGHHARARPRAREAAARDPRRRADLRRHVAHAAHARARRVRRLDAGARDRRGAAAARARPLRSRSAGARRAACTTTTSRPTTPTTRSATRTPRASCGCGACRPRRGRAARARGPRERRTEPRRAGQPLWHGRFGEGPADELLAFTVSLPFDRRLAADDLAGSRAHVQMLARVGLLTDDERGVDHRRARPRRGGARATDAFAFAPTDEDIHTAIERRVTEIAGAAGAKLHTGRSRNDQVALDLRLYLRREGHAVAARIHELQTVLLQRAGESTEIALPGLHAPAARAAGAARAPPARALLGAGPRRRPLARLPRPRRRVAARRGRARRFEPAARSRRRSRPRSGSPGRSRTRSTPSPTATSSPRRCSSPRSRRCTCRGSARRSCCGRPTSSASCGSPTRTRPARRCCRRRRTPTSPSSRGARPAG